MPDEVLMGAGSSKVLAEVVHRCAPARRARPRTAVVVGGGFDSRPWSTDIRRTTRELRPRWFTHRGVPRPDGVARLANELRDAGAEVVVAVGGGSVLDAAKAAARLAGARGVDADRVVAACVGDWAPPPSRVRTVAVPTTPGTGAEATPFATVWDVDGNRKLSLAGAAVTPAAAILDPDLLRGLGAAEVCAGLLDALCQAAEATWSVRSTARSTRYGLAAVALVGPLLERLDPRRPSGAERLALHVAGHLSGRAIALSPTSSCHAISYPLTLRAGLAHGHACGVTFGRMLRYNAGVTDADCADRRGTGWVRAAVNGITAALGVAGADEAARRIDAFLTRNGLATLDDVPVVPDLVAREALAYPRIADNPRTLDLRRLTDQLARRPVEAPCR